MSKSEIEIEVMIEQLNFMLKANCFAVNRKDLIAKVSTNFLRKKEIVGTICYSPTHVAFYYDGSVSLTYGIV